MEPTINKKQQLLVCPHCGNRTVQDIVFQLDSTDELYYAMDPDDIVEIGAIYSLTKCSTCQSISLYLNNEFDDDMEDLAKGYLCYPHESRIGNEIPKNIAGNYTEAKRVMKISRTAFAILIRRGLELMCLDQKAKGTNLKEKLSDLVLRSIIPSTLADMADTLRFLGNVGAHASEYEIDRIEAEAMNDFYVSMIEYIYVAPAKITKLKESIKRKSKA